MTDADRKAACAFAETDLGGELALGRVKRTLIRLGKFDSNPLVEAFARHREASIAPYVEALREARQAMLHIQSVCPEETLGMSDGACLGLFFNIDNAAREALAQIDALLENG